MPLQRTMLTYLELVVAIGKALVLLGIEATLPAEKQRTLDGIMGIQSVRQVFTYDELVGEPSEDEVQKLTETPVKWAISQARRRLRRHGPAIQGKGGDHHTFVAACFAGDFALSDDDFWPLFLAWNSTCVPPWPEAGLRRKLEAAREAREGAIGSGLDPVLPTRPVLPPDMAAIATTAAVGPEATSSPGDNLYGDMFWAERFAAFLSGKAISSIAMGIWLIWDGSRWCPDDGQGIAVLWKAFLQDQPRAIGDLFYQSVKLRDQWVKLFNAAKSEAVKSLALVTCSVKADRLDAHRYLLNVENGVLDFRTGQLGAHDPALLMTKLAPVVWRGIELVDPRIDRVLDTITNADAATRDCLERALGMGCTGDTSAKAFVVVAGPTDSGKGTIITGMLAMLGDYASMTDPSVFLAKSAAGRATPEVARLRGIRFAACNETDEGAAFNASKIKRIVGGGDRIVARSLYKDYIEFDETWLLVLATNHAPDGDPQDEALWRRMLHFRIEHGIDEQHRDDTLKVAFTHDLDLRSALLALCMRGVRRWVMDGAGTKGLRTSDAMRIAGRQHRHAEDAFTAFVDDILIIDPESHVSRRELYYSYAALAHQVAMGRLTEKAFFARIRAMPGIADTKIKGDRGFRGLRLNQDHPAVKVARDDRAMGEILRIGVKL